MLRHLAFAILLTTGACYSELDYRERTSATVTTPTLAVVDPGIEVLVDSSDPTFFVDGMYWRWSVGYWYSSMWWDGGWVVVPVPPIWVERVHGPRHFSHFHPGHGYSTRPAPRPVRGRR